MSKSGRSNVAISVSEPILNPWGLLELGQRQWRGWTYIAYLIVCCMNYAYHLLMQVGSQALQENAAHSVATWVHIVVLGLVSSYLFSVHPVVMRRY